MAAFSLHCFSIVCSENDFRTFLYFMCILLTPPDFPLIPQQQPTSLSISTTLSFNSAMRETKEALENVSVGLEVLKEGTGKLNFNLSLVRTSINRTLNDPGCHDEESDATTAQLCRNIRQSLSQLQISANFTRV